MQAMEKIPTDISPALEVGRHGSVAIGVRAEHNGPDGRIRKPAPNVINDNINETNGLPLGKKLCRLRSVIPKTMKSYISRKFPLETRMTDQTFDFRSAERLIGPSVDSRGRLLRREDGTQSS